MRTITTNDRLAASHAFLTFWRCVSGQKRTPLKKTEQAIDNAIDAGLNMDQIFNPANFERTKEKLQEPTPEEYLEALRDGTVPAIPIKEEENWTEEQNFAIVAESFHEFFITIVPTGGVWSTGRAKSNLAKAIGRNTLEAIMSEQLIRQISERIGTKLTCYTYVQEILENAEDYEIDTSPTKEQSELEQIKSSLGTEGDSDEDTDLKAPENYEDKELAQEWTETFDTTMDTVMTINPREWKRKAVLDALLGCSITELQDIASAVTTTNNTLEDLLTSLTDGCINTQMESPAARNAHAMINGDLSQAYICCAGIQGIQLDDDTLALHDPLLEDWDMRDKNTRTIIKLRQLIYSHGYDDEDLRNFADNLTSSPS